MYIILIIIAVAIFLVTYYILKKYLPVPGAIAGGILAVIVIFILLSLWGNSIRRNHEKKLDEVTKQNCFIPTTV